MKIFNQKHIPKITGFPFLDLSTPHAFPASTTLFLLLLSWLLLFITKHCKPKSFHTWTCCYSMFWDLKIWGCLLMLILQVVKPLPSAAVNNVQRLPSSATESQRKGRQWKFSADACCFIQETVHMDIKSSELNLKMWLIDVSQHWSSKIVYMPSEILLPRLSELSQL